MNYAIGVDIGGTKTAIGLVNKNGELVELVTLQTDLTITPEEMIQKIILEIEKLNQEKNSELSKLAGIGIGAPGPLNSKKGIIECPPNLANWRNVPIVSLLNKHFSVPVQMENDANAATLAEKWIGSAKECNDFIYMTISTGIGAGVFSDGKLLAGSSGNAGDIGHMVVDPSFGRCVCGQKGCLEWVASGTAISRLGSELKGESLKSEEVFNLYYQGDAKIIELINRVFTNIGVGCVSLINLFDPEKIVIGGGVSQAGDPLFTAARKYVQNYALSPRGRRVKIVPSVLNKNNGVIGAAALVLYNSIQKVNE